MCTKFILFVFSKGIADRTTLRSKGKLRVSPAVSRKIHLYTCHNIIFVKSLLHYSRTAFLDEFGYQKLANVGLLGMMAWWVAYLVYYEVLQGYLELSQRGFYTVSILLLPAIMPWNHSTICLLELRPHIDRKFIFKCIPKATFMVVMIFHSVLTLGVV